MVDFLDVGIVWLLILGLTLVPICDQILWIGLSRHDGYFHLCRDRGHEWMYILWGLSLYVLLGRPKRAGISNSDLARAGKACRHSKHYASSSAILSGVMGTLRQDIYSDRGGYLFFPTFH